MFVCLTVVVLFTRRTQMLVGRLKLSKLSSVTVKTKKIEKTGLLCGPLLQMELICNNVLRRKNGKIACQIKKKENLHQCCFRKKLCLTMLLACLALLVLLNLTVTIIIIIIVSNNPTWSFVHENKFCLVSL